MEKKQIITIAGKPGSGKSTTSKGVAAALGFEHFSSGDLFREIAKERGVDVYKINVLAETEKEIDYQVDNKLKELGENENRLVVDSRTAWHWIPQSFKVYLDLNLDEAAKRITSLRNKTRLEAEHIPANPVEYAKELQKRLDSESKRYSNLYGIDPYNKNNYDLVVDTSKNDPKAVVEEVVTKFKEWLEA